MDFVYDKPIFTQWTFAPAEPKSTKGKASLAALSKLTTDHSKRRRRRKAAKKKRLEKAQLLSEMPYNVYDLKGKLKTVFRHANSREQKKLISISKTFAAKHHRTEEVIDYYKRAGKKIE